MNPLKKKDCPRCGEKIISMSAHWCKRIEEEKPQDENKKVVDCLVPYENKELFHEAMKYGTPVIIEFYRRALLNKDYRIRELENELALKKEFEKVVIEAMKKDNRK